MSFLGVVSQQPDADLIMRKLRDLSITGSMSARINLIITEKNGAQRMRTIAMTTKSYSDSVEKRFIKFIEPADVRGTAMLIIDNESIDDDMWIFLPALRKTRRIVSSEKGKSFMSSEFSNADMSSPALSDFTHSHIKTSGEDNQWIIESIPVNKDKEDEYGYSGKISYIGINNYQISKMEFYNFDNELYKTITIESVYPLSDGKYLVKDMVATNYLTKRRSEIRMSDITTGADVDDSVFSLKNLER
jgi:hypothetical protein